MSTTLACSDVMKTESIGARQRSRQPLSTPLPVIAVIVVLLGLTAGCTGGSRLADDSPSLPTAAPTASGPTPTPEPYPISSIPRCPGFQELASPLKFDWPNIDEAMKKLADYTWGYYGCAVPQTELQNFFRQNMRKTPYLWEEVNGTQYQGGSVYVYYHSVYATWVYIWMLPQTDKQMSYLVIAKGNPGVGNTWECDSWFTGAAPSGIPGGFSRAGPAGNREG
jgi:hypothetical protein